MTESSPDEAGGGALLGEGILGMIQPAVEQLDNQVHNTRVSQYTLNTHIQALADCEFAAFLPVSCSNVYVAAPCTHSFTFICQIF